MILHALGGGPAWSGLAALAPGPTLAAGAVAPVMLWLGALLIVVFVGGFALLFIRRWLLDSGAGEAESGWDLHSLRAMRDRGELSDQEYEIARSRIIDAFSTPRATTPTPGAAGPMPHSGGELRAPAGFDLTGEPLPDFSGGENAATDDEEGPEN